MHFANQLLDPEVYAQGEYISVRGTVSGTESGKIDEFPYTYITLEGSGLYLWPEKKKADVHYVIGLDPYPRYYYRGYPYPYRYGPSSSFVYPASKSSSKAPSKSANSDE